MLQTLKELWVLESCRDLVSGSGLGLSLDGQRGRAPFLDEPGSFRKCGSLVALNHLIDLLRASKHGTPLF